MVTITDENRLFGADSFIEQTKYPKNSFNYVLRYLGETYNEDSAKKLRN